MAKGSSITTYQLVYGEACRSRGNTSALIVTRRGPSELSRGFMDSWLSGSRSGFLMVVLFHTRASSSWFGSHGSFPMAVLVHAAVS